MQLVTPKTSPLLTVRVHVPLTVSAGKYSESSGPCDLRVLVLIYSDRHVKKHEEASSALLQLSQGRTPSSRTEHLVFRVWFVVAVALSPHTSISSWQSSFHRPYSCYTRQQPATLSQIRFVRICFSPDVAWTHIIISSLFYFTLNCRYHFWALWCRLLLVNESTTVQF